MTKTVTRTGLGSWIEWQIVEVRDTTLEADDSFTNVHYFELEEIEKGKIVSLGRFDRRLAAEKVLMHREEAARKEIRAQIEAR